MYEMCEYANTTLAVHWTWLLWMLLSLRFARLIGARQLAQQWLSAHARMLPLSAYYRW